MSIARGRRIVGFGVFLLLFLPSCATYHESMDTMRKAFPGAKPIDSGSGSPASSDNASTKPPK